MSSSSSSYLAAKPLTPPPLLFSSPPCRSYFPLPPPSSSVLSSLFFFITHLFIFFFFLCLFLMPFDYLSSFSVSQFHVPIHSLSIFLCSLLYFSLPPFSSLPFLSCSLSFLLPCLSLLRPLHYFPSFLVLSSSFPPAVYPIFLSTYITVLSLPQPFLSIFVFSLVSFPPCSPFLSCLSFLQQNPKLFNFP